MIKCTIILHSDAFTVYIFIVLLRVIIELDLLFSDGEMWFFFFASLNQFILASFVFSALTAQAQCFRMNTRRQQEIIRKHWVDHLVVDINKEHTFSLQKHMKSSRRNIGQVVP